jgi:SAM-dependent methyltransferase
MDKNYYHQYYHYERNHWWFIVRGKIIMDQIKGLTNKKTLRILNIGVATGRTTELLSQFGVVTSVEYDHDCCQFLRDHLHMEVINASITELPFEDNSFDLVCAFDVIEHVEDHVKATQEIRRVCTNQGHAIVTVPALMSLWSDHDVINHHVRRYKKQELKALFAPLKGETVKAIYFNSLLFPLIYVFRKLGLNKNEDNAKSDFESSKSSLLNKVFYGLFSLERKILKWVSFPIGVSILLAFRKES